MYIDIIIRVMWQAFQYTLEYGRILLLQRFLVDGVSLIEYVKTLIISYFDIEPYKVYFGSSFIKYMFWVNNIVFFHCIMSIF